jgi:hypothetical protein
MIIGIDESGNFDESSNLRHLFVAAFIESKNGKLEIKKQQFLNWEKRLPKETKNQHGEVKGNNLNQQQLLEFLGTVVIQPPFVRTACVSIVPNKNPVHIIEKHRKSEIKQIEYSHTLSSNLGTKKRNLNFLESYVKWLKKRSNRDYLKMLCLKNLLKNSFHNIIIHCIMNGRIEESLDVYYKIDKDFLTEENIFWEHYSRRSIQNYTQKNPWPVLDTWDSEHPFIKKYMYEADGRSVININLIYKNLNFLDSKENIEIRIADVIGIILNRYYNKNELKNEFDLLSKTGIVKDEHLELRLPDFDLEQTLELFKKQHLE